MESSDLGFNTLKEKCKYLYLSSHYSGFGKKYLYYNWVTNIIFGCFIIACEIGLAIFWFLVFKNLDSSGILALQIWIKNYFINWKNN